MTVATILGQKGSAVVTVGSGETLEAVTGVLEEHGIGAVVVSDADMQIEGIVSERDIVRAVARHGAEALQKPVSAFMTRDVVTCGEDEGIATLMQRMTQGKFRHLPVARDGKLVGIISIGDVVKRRIAEAELEAQAMREYIATG